MTTITVADIERDVAGYLGRVRAGESLLVTEANKPIAEIKPVVSDEGKKTGLFVSLGWRLASSWCRMISMTLCPKKPFEISREDNTRKGRGKPYPYTIRFSL